MVTRWKLNILFPSFLQQLERFYIYFGEYLGYIYLIHYIWNEIVRNWPIIYFSTIWMSNCISSMLWKGHSYCTELKQMNAVLFLGIKPWWRPATHSSQLICFGTSQSSGSASWREVSSAHTSAVLWPWKPWKSDATASLETCCWAVDIPFFHYLTITNKDIRQIILGGLEIRVTLLFKQKHQSLMNMEHTVFHKTVDNIPHLLNSRGDQKNCLYFP